MPKPTSRRTSLQPVFEPFEVLDSESMMQPLQTNGYHLASGDDDGSLFGGLHCEPSEAGANGLHGEPPAIEAPADESVADESRADDSAAHEAGVNGSSTRGIFALNGFANSAAHQAPSRIADEFADVVNGDSDLADLAAAKAAFAAGESEAQENHHAAADQNGSAPSNGFAAIDVAALNGHAHLNGEHALNGEHVLNGVENRIDPAAGELQAATAPAADVQANGSAVAYQADASAEVAVRTAISDAPPVIESEPARPPVEPSLNGAATYAPQTPAYPAQTPPAIEPHPAAGSLFVPYLVTEIRELRSRTQRRRSWWRRLFG